MHDSKKFWETILSLPRPLIPTLLPCWGIKILSAIDVIKLLKWVRTKLPSRLLNRIGPYYLYFRLKGKFSGVYYARRALQCYYLVYYLWRLWCRSSSRFRVNWRNAWLGFNRRFNWWWWSDFRLHWLTKENTTHTNLLHKSTSLLQLQIINLQIKFFHFYVLKLLNFFSNITEKWINLGNFTKDFGKQALSSLLKARCLWKQQYVKAFRYNI